MTEEKKEMNEKKSTSLGEEAKAASDKKTGKTGDFPPPLPEIDFSTFIFSLNSSVLVHLGAVDDPVSGGKVKNLPIAKHTIDIISMLADKTKGNLTPDEEKLIKNILFELRMMYVKEIG